MKKRLAQEHQFEILLLVLDKVLWLGFGIMTFGLYKMTSTGIVSEGLNYLIAGIILLTIFVWLLIKEYHF
ncbi:hypothetical protein J4418_01735 [Candidatus Woesearchaeota archaeon]|nr:hypothetical protein [Candidatus Woesearchaeota archaeon]